MTRRIITGTKDEGNLYEQREDGKFLDVARLLSGCLIKVVGDGAFAFEEEFLLEHRGGRELSEEEYSMLMFSLSNTDGGLQIEMTTMIPEEGEVR